MRIVKQLMRRCHVLHSCGFFRESGVENPGGRRYMSKLGSAVRPDLFDLTRPYTWYPFARSKKRQIILHVGPTNSGKTYAAMQRLQACISGIYCGPLRLLAWEVAERMNQANIPCSLITGQERREVDGAKHVAMTVEMADVASEYECGIIDEIQMIGSRNRGSSVTRALLGLAVDELHLCGDAAAVDLVEKITAETGDSVEVRHYERLAPLSVAEFALGKYSRVRRGDCVVAFSRKDIYTIKSEIEKKGKHQCSVIYGSLPPETRKGQAEKFNDPNSGFDTLVASDAVGMGLNLNIRQIVFSTLEKFDGIRVRPLDVVEIKQIAGRAGRFGSRYPRGSVTCLNESDMPRLEDALAAPSPLVKSAGLFPSYEQLAVYSSTHPSATFTDVLKQFVKNARLSSHYFIRDCDGMLAIGELLEELSLSLSERYIFSLSPVETDDPVSMAALLKFATDYSLDKKVHQEKKFTSKTIRLPRRQIRLQELESQHKILDLYIWLSLRLGDAFVDHDIALTQKYLCGMIIEEGVRAVGLKPSKRQKIKVQQKMLRDEAWKLEKQEMLSAASETNSDSEDGSEESSDEELDEAGTRDETLLPK